MTGIDRTDGDNGLIPTYRGAVNAWECDNMGHMNVQFYVAKAADALGFLRLALGLSPAAIATRRLTLLPAEDRVLFRRELRAGDILTMASGIRAVDDEGCLSHTEVRNREKGEIAAIFERRLVPFDLDRRETAPWPADVRLQAEALAARFAGPPMPAPQGPEAPGPDAAPLESYRGFVNAWEADENGLAALRFHIHRFSNAMSQVWNTLGLAGAARLERNLGGAALDYVVRYHRPLKPADAVLVRSGLIEAGSKVIRLYHHMIDAATSAPVTSIEIVLVTFDLARRKSVPLPPEVRARAEALGARLV